MILKNIANKTKWEFDNDTNILPVEANQRIYEIGMPHANLTNVVTIRKAIGENNTTIKTHINTIDTTIQETIEGKYNNDMYMRWGNEKRNTRTLRRKQSGLMPNRKLETTKSTERRHEWKGGNATTIIQCDTR